MAGRKGKDREEEDEERGERERATVKDDFELATVV